MKIGKKIALVTISMIILLLVLRIIILSHVIEYSPPLPPSIDNIRSEKPIYFDATTGENGDIHLIWSGEKNVLTYQNSKDGGATWNNIQKLADTESFSRIVSVDNMLVILWAEEGNLYHIISNDNGTNWSQKNNVMSPPVDRQIPTDTGTIWSNDIEDMSKAPGALYSIFSSSNQIIIIYGAIRHRGTYISKSDDFGFHWSKPVKLFPNHNCSTIAPQFAAALNHENIHIIYRNYEPKGSNEVGLYYIHSADLGDTWEDRGKIYTPLKFTDTSKNHDLMQGDPQLAVNDSVILLVLRDRYPYYISSRDCGNSWTKPIGLKDVVAGSYSLFANDNESVLITFATGKHTGREWWGYIPLWWVLAWDANPTWYNNDLYYTMFKDSTFTNPIRLTRQYSYVGGAKAIAAAENDAICLKIGKKSIIFWSGKRKVTNSLNNSQVPFELFYHIVDIK